MGNLEATADLLKLRRSKWSAVSVFALMEIRGKTEEGVEQSVGRNWVVLASIHMKYALN